MSSLVISRLQSLTEKWGGSFLRANWYDWRTCPVGIIEAPFASYPLGVNFNMKVIAFDPKRVKWQHIIHEMGHVFASDNHPEKTDEYQFLGWEYIIAKQVGGSMREWHEQNGEYEVHDDVIKITTCWHKLTKKDRSRIIKDRIDEAVNIGILRPEGRKLIPVAIR